MINRILLGLGATLLSFNAAAQIPAQELSCAGDLAGHQVYELHQLVNPQVYEDGVLGNVRQYLSADESLEQAGLPSKVQLGKRLFQDGAVVKLSTVYWQNSDGAIIFCNTFVQNEMTEGWERPYYDIMNIAGLREEFHDKGWVGQSQQVVTMDPMAFEYNEHYTLSIPNFGDFQIEDIYQGRTASTTTHGRQTGYTMKGAAPAAEVINTSWGENFFPSGITRMTPSRDLYNEAEDQCIELHGEDECRDMDGLYYSIDLIGFRSSYTDITLFDGVSLNDDGSFQTAAAGASWLRQFYDPVQPAVVKNAVRMMQNAADGAPWFQALDNNFDGSNTYDYASYIHANDLTTTPMYFVSGAGGRPPYGYDELDTDSFYTLFSFFSDTQFEDGIRADVLGPANGHGHGVPFNVVAGNSFATPKLPGMVAVINGMFPHISREEVAEAVVRNAWSAPDWELPDRIYGNGILNPKAAVDALIDQYTPDDYTTHRVEVDMIYYDADDVRHSVKVWSFDQQYISQRSEVINAAGNPQRIAGLLAGSPMLGQAVANMVDQLGITDTRRVNVTIQSPHSAYTTTYAQLNTDTPVI